MATITDDPAADEATRILQERLAQEGVEPGAPVESLGDAAEDDVTPVTDLDDIEKNVPHREWKFEGDFKVRVRDEDVEQHFEGVYVQKPLSYQAMMEFTGLVGRQLDRVMQGAGGLSIDSLLGGMSADGSLPIAIDNGRIVIQEDQASRISPDSILSIAVKIAILAPDILPEAQCIWLRVPRTERAIIMDIWSRPVDEGGLSVNDGNEMMELFVEQNWEELEAFFVRRWAKLRSTVERARKRASLRAA